MQKRNFLMCLFMLCALYGLGTHEVLANKRLGYPWIVDGKHYTGRVLPPGQAKKGYFILYDVGEPVEVPAELTALERDHEAQLAKLRAKLDKLILIQRNHDKTLLSTYRTKEDFIAGIKRKNQSMDTVRKTLENNLNGLNLQLAEQQKKAAAFERNGEKLSEELVENLLSTQQQIPVVREQIKEQMIKEMQQKREDASDLERFLYLTQTISDDIEKYKIPNITEATELGLFYCRNDTQCNQAWNIARAFVDEFSTTPADVDTDRLVMHRPPAVDSDLSLSLSKLVLHQDEYQLFLDIRCRESKAGKELCDSDKVKNLRTSFQGYVNHALTRATQ